MTDEEGLPQIVTFLDQGSGKGLYHDIIKKNLREILPHDFFETKSIAAKLKKSLPHTHFKDSHRVPGTLTFLSLSRSRPAVFKFFFHMISQWLIPGERLNVTLINAVDFYMPEISQEIYTLCEIIIRVENEEKLKLIKQNFPIIDSEIKLGLESKYFADKIREMKGLHADEKTSLIQEYIANLIKKLPRLFDQHIFSEMQHILLITPDKFKEERAFKHLGRIISAQFLMRKDLLRNIRENGSKRHVYIKLIRLGSSRLGIVVGLNFLRDKEVFEDKQLFNAIHHHLEMIKPREGSYILNRRGQELLTTVYIEVERASSFTHEELKNLKHELPKDLKNHVEHLLHPIFMPRNEEEIIRNIVALANQLKYSRDIPQVFISFDQQSRASLFFNIIIVRVLKKGIHPIQDHFKKSFLKYIHDRTKIVGTIRKTYSKEATVFRVKFSKDDFLRADRSIDLYKARQAVANELGLLIGEFRDFNGGMISKQSELFTKVKESLLQEKEKFNPVMLENVFYSLTPVIMQTVLEAEAFKRMFQFLLARIKKGIPAQQKFVYKILSEDNFVYLVILSHDRACSDNIDAIIMKYKHASTELASIDIKVNDLICTGYIYRSQDEGKRIIFAHSIENSIQTINKSL